MRNIKNLQRGIGIGGWLTNYKRFNVLPRERRMQITVGDMEHFESYITENDIAYIHQTTETDSVLWMMTTEKF